jgi:hypothetical protein
MFSIKGIFKQDTIHLLEPLNIKERTNVIITFMDEDDPSAEVDEFSDATEMDEPSGGFFSEDLDSMSPDDLDEFEGIGDMEDMADLDADDLEVMSTDDDDELSEEYYSKIRKHKRYIANGNISLVEGETEIIYPLFDYSAGGLSFVSDTEFDVGISLTASIKDPIEQDMSVLDFEFEVARVVDFNGKFKIGCKFFDEVDEEIWHSLMS